MFRKLALLASLVAVVVGSSASAPQAATRFTPLTRANSITVSRAASLPGVTLAPGSYVFESGPAGTNPNIVRVTSQNRQEVFYLGFTIPIVRRQGTEPDILTFGEAANGAPAPILAWYPVGSNSGHAFMR